MAADLPTLLLVAAQLGALVALRHIPTQDGPMHLEIAALLRRLLAGEPTVARELFVVNPAIEPNWLVHGVLAVLLGVVAPATAEKIVVVAYGLVAAAAAAWALDGAAPGGRRLVPLVLPILFAFPFHMGFYNFCFGIAALLAIAGFWLRRGDAPRPRDAVVLAGLLLASYLCHPVALFLGFGVVGMLGIARGVRDLARGDRFAAVVRRQLVPGFLACVPSLALALAYLSADAGRPTIRVGLHRLWSHLGSAEALVSYDRLERPLARLWIDLLLVAGVVALAAVRARRGGDPAARWALLATALVVAGLALVVPTGLAGGGYLNQRLQLMAYLFGVLWLAAAFRGASLAWRIAGALLQTAAIALAAGFLWLHVAAYRRLEPLLAEYTSATAAVPPGSVLLALSFDDRGRAAGGGGALKIRPFQHASGYLGAVRDVADLTLYQASMGYFPILYRTDRDPYLHLGSTEALERESHDFELAPYERATGVRVDAVLLWGFDLAPPEVRSAWGRRLAGFRPVFSSTAGRAQVLLRR